MNPTKVLSVRFFLVEILLRSVKTGLVQDIYFNINIFYEIIYDFSIYFYNFPKNEATKFLLVSRIISNSSAMLPISGKIGRGKYVKNEFNSIVNFKLFNEGGNDIQISNICWNPFCRCFKLYPHGEINLYEEYS